MPIIGLFMCLLQGLCASTLVLKGKGFQGEENKGNWLGRSKRHQTLCRKSSLKETKESTIKEALTATANSPITGRFIKMFTAPFSTEYHRTYTRTLAVSGVQMFTSALGWTKADSSKKEAWIVLPKLTGRQPLTVWVQVLLLESKDQEI